MFELSASSCSSNRLANTTSSSRIAGADEGGGRHAPSLRKIDWRSGIWTNPTRTKGIYVGTSLHRHKGPLLPFVVATRSPSFDDTSVRSRRLTRSIKTLQLSFWFVGTGLSEIGASVGGPLVALRKETVGERNDAKDRQMYRRRDNLRDSNILLYREDQAFGAQVLCLQPEGCTRRSSRESEQGFIEIVTVATGYVMGQRNDYRYRCGVQGRCKGAIAIRLEYGKRL
jgi:hypothetical protein